jgi:hypothetical protein
MQVREVQLTGRKFTWSNKQSSLTLSRIDRVFCTPTWEELYAQSHIQPISSLISNHCPLLLTSSNIPKFKPRFRFESHWVSMPSFHEKVHEAWNKEVPPNFNHLVTSHIKLSRTTKAIRRWYISLVPQGRLAGVICREVINQLERARENKALTPHEGNLVKQLKHILLGLVAIEKSRARSKSRITWLRKGGEQNYIHSLQTENSVALRQRDKQDIVYNHYLEHIGSHIPRSCLLNLARLRWQSQDLECLYVPFTEEELKSVISEAPKEKASGPDGFIGIYFVHCWETISGDIVRVVHQFYQLNQQGLHFLNQALVVLIPKKENPQGITYFMPISLTHNFAKIISKLLASRLGPKLEHLISVNQSAFITTKMYS